MKNNCLALSALALAIAVGTPSARGDVVYEVVDATYGPSAIKITFSWDGNANDAPTDFTWSTPLSNSAIYGTVTNADIALWDSIGFPDGTRNLAVYLLTADPAWSEDCTGPAGGVSPIFCDAPGSRIDLNIRDAVVGTYGFQLNRELDLTQVDTIASGTLVPFVPFATTPEPSTVALIGVELLLVGRLVRVRRRT
jgi:hypothetical protein